MGTWYLKENNSPFCRSFTQALLAMGESLTKDPAAGDGVFCFPSCGEALTPSLLPLLEQRKEGAVLILYPYPLWEGDPLRPEQSEWAGGLSSAVRALARRFAPHLRINALRYGFTREDEVSEEALASVALGRKADIREIARAALFFVGEGSSFMTGQSIDVNGGRVY